MKLKKRFIWNHPASLLLIPRLSKVSPYTKLSFDALVQAWNIVGELDQKNIPGAVVELGCWNGGCGALMASRIKKDGATRNVWLFDSFEGLPELAVQDEEWAKDIGQNVKSSASQEMKATGYFKAEEKNVREIAERLGVSDIVKIAKGWFQDTIPQIKGEIGPIALLRLDGDIYESTKYPLEAFYDAVTPGGYIVIDDFHLQGCRQAVYEFFAEKKVWPLLMNSPRDGRAYFRKK